MNNIKNYWKDIDTRIEKLLKNGAVKFPSLKEFDLDNFANDISAEMGSFTFKELSFAHKKFLDHIQIDKFLAPKLLEVAKKVFGFDGNLSNQYHIARKVMPGNINEQYRAHFDSHIFTLVLPLKIPYSPSKITLENLFIFQKLEKCPKNEIINLIEKFYYKRFASKKGLEKLSKNNLKKIDNFIDCQPLLFLGKTTLHTNYPVSFDCSTHRLTLLAHYFDDFL